jgi:ribosomal protein S18 acetylase RimI-like enzyme
MSEREPNRGVQLLRVATVHDAAFISRTVIRSWQDAYRDFLPWSFLASLDQNPYHDPHAWESRIKEPSSVTWIISDTCNDVGVLRIVAGASFIPGTDSQLTTLYLLRQSRGHGLGSEALAFARAEAARRAKPILGVCVLAGNKAGQAFYERQGARRIGERVAFRLDKEPIIDILYRFASVAVESPAAESPPA